MDNNNNNNNNTEKDKSIEDIFCDLYEESESEYTYEQERTRYNNTGSGRRASYKKNKTRKSILMVLVILVLAAMWLFAAASIVKYVNGPELPIADDTTDYSDVTDDGAVDSGDADTTDGADTSGVQTPGFIDVSMAEGSYKLGELILVNSTYTYDQKKDTYLTKELVSVWEYARQNLVVSQQADMLRIDTVSAMIEMFSAFKTETGLSGYCFRPDYGFCTADQQQTWYDATAVKHPGKANAYEFKAGEGEHETGRAFDLKVEQNGAGVYIRNAASEYMWIYDNCYKYGIIYRYPSDKTEITGVSMAANSTHADHFRYVGKAAAAAMHKNSWCLEQFLAEMDKYTYNGEHLKVEGADGVKYEMYFYPANMQGETQVKVPADSTYSISGNNIDGFIVTVTMK